MLFGATHQRGDADPVVRDEDDRANLSALATVRPALAEAVTAKGTKARAAVRAALPDHLPLAGALAPGLYLLAGLGGRGFTLAPLLAEQMAAEMSGTPRPMDGRLAKLCDPKRYGQLSPGTDPAGNTTP